MRRLVTSILLTCLLLASPAGTAEIYKWRDENGRLHFSDTPPASGQSEQVELRPVNTYNAPSKILVDETLSREVTHPEKRPAVIMYTTSWCGVCVKAKQWFRENRVTFTEYDVEKSERGRQDFAKLGGGGVPVIFVGKQRMNGFSPSRMQDMLRNAGYRI